LENANFFFINAIQAASEREHAAVLNAKSNFTKMTSIGVLIPENNRQGLFSKRDWQRLESLGRLKVNELGRPMNGEEACALLQDCEVALGSWGTPHPGTLGLLEACPRLRLWEHVAGSVKGMFGPHLQGRSLTIASCAPAIAENVAEFVLAQLIDGLRGISANAEANRHELRPHPRHRKCLSEAVVGVLGASQVGRKVIPLLNRMGATVLVYDPFLSAEEAGRLGVAREADLLEVFRRSDAVTMHTPLLPSTRHLVGAPHLQALRDGAVLVNASRGECLDERALVEELKRGRITAYLDVSSPEPAAMESELRSLPNCRYTSHIAGGGSHRLGAQAVEDVEKFLRGERPLMTVTEAMLDRLA
jgi:phosphoglycerate dehydrogenase-like enzyme